MVCQSSTPILEFFSDDVLDLICRIVRAAGKVEAESKSKILSKTVNEVPMIPSCTYFIP